MTRLPLSFLLVSLLACSSDRHTAEPPPPSAPPAAPAPTPASTTTPPLTTTGVYLDPSIASACGITQPRMFFRFDSAEVKNTDSEVIDTLSRCLMEGALKGKAFEIVGRADPRGSDEYNRKLGKSRADSVADVLSGRGVSKAMLQTRSTGEQTAIGTDADGWAQDRRVDIRLVR